VATEVREVLTVANVRRVRLGVYGLSRWLKTVKMDALQCVRKAPETVPLGRRIIPLIVLLAAGVWTASAIAESVQTGLCRICVRNSCF
jgi:hypothetical protein